MYANEPLLVTTSSCGCQRTFCNCHQRMVEYALRPYGVTVINSRDYQFSTTTSWSAPISLPDFKPLRSFTQLVNQRCSPHLFRPEHTLSRFTQMEKLRWLRLDERSTEPASPALRSTRTTRRTPASSWHSALRRWSGRRS